MAKVGRAEADRGEQHLDVGGGRKGAAGAWALGAATDAPPVAGLEWWQVDIAWGCIKVLQVRADATARSPPLAPAP